MSNDRALGGVSRLKQVKRICREDPTLSVSGRTLFTASRARKSSSNDADRLRKCLARFDLDWQSRCGRSGSATL